MDFPSYSYKEWTLVFQKKNLNENTLYTLNTVITIKNTTFPKSLMIYFFVANAFLI